MKKNNNENQNERWKYFKIAVLLLFTFTFSAGFAQQAITVSGGNASGASGSVSYSVGQIVYTTNAATNGSVAQGVQQPYEISIITGLEEAIGINLNLSAYPNPTKDFLNLKVENYNMDNLSYQFFDINGKLLENKKISDVETVISIGHLSTAVYFLKIFDKNNEIKVFKIIKN